MEGICYIIGAGSVAGEAISPGAGDLVIAADGGWAALEALGVEAQLVVGDFDSLGYVPRHPQVFRHPPEKDDTDMGLAIALGLERGYRAFVLLGGLGGRLDHTLANLQLLHRLALRGCRCQLRGEGLVCAAVHNGALDLPLRREGHVSVFSLEAESRGVTLTGLQYPLDRGTLTYTYPLGVSNAFTGRPARVAVEEGTLLVMWESREG